jgi:hypothetical protein
MPEDPDPAQLFEKLVERRHVIVALERHRHGADLL